MANTTSTVAIVWGNRMEIMAGTPIDSSSNIANNGNAVGIVVENVYRGAATATVITAGEWNEDFGAANAGIRISDDAKRALSAISFVDDDGTKLPAKSVPTPTLSNAGKHPVVDEYGNTYYLDDYPTVPEATEEVAGVVKMAESVADSTGETSPTTAEFNALLAALRAAGIMAETEETTDPPSEE